MSWFRLRRGRGRWGNVPSSLILLSTRRAWFGRRWAFIFAYWFWYRLINWIEIIRFTIIYLLFFFSSFNSFFFIWLNYLLFRLFSRFRFSFSFNLFDLLCHENRTNGFFFPFYFSIEKNPVIICLIKRLMSLIRFLDHVSEQFVLTWLSL